MEYDGSLEDKETISLRIRPTESIGLHPLLEMLYLQPSFMRLRGMELYGSLEVMD
jgi:hypothetical protein